MTEPTPQAVTELIWEDLKYVREKVDHIDDKLDLKADRSELDLVKAKQAKLIAAKDYIYGAILVASHWAASLFR